MFLYSLFLFQFQTGTTEKYHLKTRREKKKNGFCIVPGSKSMRINPRNKAREWCEQQQKINYERNEKLKRDKKNNNNNYKTTETVNGVKVFKAIHMPEYSD